MKLYDLKGNCSNMLGFCSQANMWTTEDERERLTLALEPEGAAICCQKDLIAIWQRLGKSDFVRYMVVDCGGGTIDFTIHDLNIDTMKMAEIYRATGNKRGGMMVDEEIKQFIVKKKKVKAPIEEEITDDDWLSFERGNVENCKVKMVMTLTKLPWHSHTVHLVMRLLPPQVFPEGPKSSEEGCPFQKVTTSSSSRHH